MSESFIVCAVLKPAATSDPKSRGQELSDLVEGLRRGNENGHRDLPGFTTSIIDDGEVVLVLPDALGASRTADALMARALAANAAGKPIGALSVWIDAGAAAEQTRLAVGGLKVARDVAANNQIVIARSIYERLPLLERDTYGAEEQVGNRTIRRRFGLGTEACFVVSPIGEEGSNERQRADFVFDEFVKRACAELNLRPYRSDHQFSRGIREEMMRSISQANLVFAYVGGPRWNPNVMIEIGYRLASGGALIIVRDSPADAACDEPLPFDISDLQILSLPPRAEESDAAARDDAVANLVRAIKAALENLPQPWNSHHPFMQIEIDRDRAVGMIKAATRDAERLFAHGGRLVGVKIADVIAKLQQYMPDGQFHAFGMEQNHLITRLTGAGPVYGNVDAEAPVDHVTATVPMVFEGHPDKHFDQRAFLPIIVRYDSGSHADRLVLNALYLDVTSVTRVVDGVFTCRLEQSGERSALLWDHYAVSYDRILPRLSTYRQAVARHIEAMSAEDIRSVLDLGCGTGNVTLPLLAKGKYVAAVDRSAAMLELLREKLARLEHPNTSVYEQSAETLRFLDGRFDGVTVLLALFAMEKPLRALHEAIRVLKPGGTICLTEPKESFCLAPLLEQAEVELRRGGLMDELAIHWKRVSAVNRRIDPAAKPKLPSTQIIAILENEGFTDITRLDSHLGNCENIQARKPR